MVRASQKLSFMLVLSMGLGLLCEDYHNKFWARKNYNSVTHEKGNDMTDDLFLNFNLNVSKFGIRTSKINRPINCLPVRWMYCKASKCVDMNHHCMLAWTIAACWHELLPHVDMNYCCTLTWTIAAHWHEPLQHVDMNHCCMLTRTIAACWCEPLPHVDMNHCSMLMRTIAACWHEPLPHVDMNHCSMLMQTIAACWHEPLQHNKLCTSLCT